MSIDRLPTELLGAIFINGALQPIERPSPSRHGAKALHQTFLPCETVWDPFTFSPRDFVSRVCLVCSRWYSVAIGTPVLWSRIDISSANADSIASANRFLERSGGYCVDIHFDISKSIKLLDEDYLRCVDLVLSALGRCRALVAEASASYRRCGHKHVADHFILKLANYPYPVPVLRYLDLWELKGSSLNVLPLPFAHNSPPHLQSLMAPRVMCQGTEVLSFLVPSLCGSLHSLAFTNDDLNLSVWFLTDPDNHRIELPVLCTLTVGDEIQLFHLLLRIHAPQLRALNVHCRWLHNLEVSILPHRVALRQITHFTYNFCDSLLLSRGPYTKLLEYLPELRFLHFKFSLAAPWAPGNSFVAALAMAPVCPKLDHLRLHACMSDRWDELGGMLKARAAAIARLDVWHADFTSPAAREMHARRLRAYVREVHIVHADRAHYDPVHVGTAHREVV